MQCLKCGKDVSADLTFCEECLAEMAQYPVDPGTAIHIPKRTAPERRPAASREPSAAELLSRARKTIRWLFLLVILLSLLLSVTGIMLIRTLDRTTQPQGPVKGQNYTTNQQS